MARLYTGLDAIGLGNAVHNIHNGIGARNTSALQLLGGELKDYFAQRAEEQKEAARKQDAIDFLMGRGGMDEASARQFAGTVDPSEAVRYMQSRLDSQADKADERGYEQTIHDRNRGETLEDKIYDNAYAWQDWLRKHNIETKDRIAFDEFNNINSMITALQMKVQSGSLPSKQDIEEMNQLKSMRNEWIKQHPNFSQIMFASGMGDSSANPFESKESAMAALKALIGNDGFVDPKGLNDLNTQFLWQTGRNLFNDPEYKDTYNHLAKRQRGNKNKRNAQNPESAGIVTQEDLENIEKNAAEMSRLSGLHKTIHNALQKGKTSELQNISDNDLEKLLLLEGDGKLKKGVVSVFKKRRKSNGGK